MTELRKNPLPVEIALGLADDIWAIQSQETQQKIINKRLEDETLRRVANQIQTLVGPKNWAKFLEQKKAEFDTELEEPVIYERTQYAS